tara:strand:+ start:3484 stop:4161 length:678 start_codon:yes stop_codon:yes gene_type:complete
MTRKQEARTKHNRLVGKTANQKKYIQSIKNNRITLCIGPAGTGKTYIAATSGLLGLLDNEYKKIVLTRPLVQAGEDTGFLPGDIDNKLAPYIRPIFDEFLLKTRQSELQTLRGQGAIEIVPFAYMRGRNFYNSFILCDEAQNASKKQLKLLLTRLGQSSKMVLAGDIAQSDLASGSNQFVDIINKLEGLENVGIVRLTTRDIIRDPLIEKILERLEDEKKANIST